MHDGRRSVAVEKHFQNYLASCSADLHDCPLITPSTRSLAL